MKTAKVIRPIFDETKTSPKVTLTAKVTKGDVIKELDLNLTVRMQGVSDSQSVILDANNITLVSETKTNIELPLIGKNGSTITWATSDAALITASGVVSRPATTGTDTEVTLTATCKKQSKPTDPVETQTSTFKVTVKAWTVLEEVEDAATKVTWDLVKGINSNSQAITDNLVLPGSVGRSVAAVWSIISTSDTTGTTNGKINISTGVVTRPTYTQGQVSIQIACELTKGTETKTVTLPPFILSPLAMTDQEVLDTAVTLLESSRFLGTNESLAKITADMELPYRLSDVDASKATISWALVTAGTHTALASSPYITLTPTASYTLADITRPTTSQGNVTTVGLNAIITVGSLQNKTRFFDLTILTA